MLLTLLMFSSLLLWELTDTKTTFGSVNKYNICLLDKVNEIRLCRFYSALAAVGQLRSIKVFNQAVISHFERFSLSLFIFLLYFGNILISFRCVFALKELSLNAANNKKWFFTCFCLYWKLRSLAQGVCARGRGSVCVRGSVCKRERNIYNVTRNP